MENFSSCCPSELPLNFLTPLSDVQVYEKDEARFELELSRPPKSFRWLKGSQELQGDDKYEMIQEGNMYVLVIRSAAFDDEAKYMFEAEDKRTTGKLVIQGDNSFHQTYQTQELIFVLHRFYDTKEHFYFLKVFFHISNLT